MPKVLYDNGEHKCVAFNDLVQGEAIQSNQFLIVSGGEGMLLDPGGNLTYKELLAEMASYFLPSHLRYVFASHEDPDIVASANGWLLITDAKILIAEEWTRFLPHFCSKGATSGRVTPIPWEGMTLPLGSEALLIIPAHYLHAVGNFQIYDPVSRILFSGDVGANLVNAKEASRSIETVAEFEHWLDAHGMNAFHRHYMSGNRACRVWVKKIRELEVEWIVPQHGASFRGREVVARFLDWFENLSCGIDLLEA